MMAWPIKTLELHYPMIQFLTIRSKPCTYSLRSNDSKILSVPPVKGKKTLGDRSFMLAAPKLWNDLPRDLRLVDNISSFKKQLKTHLFKLA